MNNPLVVYLDTQDYSNLYDIKTKEMQSIFNFLCEKVEKKEIIIPYSYFIIAELLTAYKEEFKEDRLLRVKVIKRLCGNYAFRFIDSSLSQENALSKNGNWYPRFEYWEKFKSGIEEETVNIIRLLPNKIAKKLNKKNPWPQLFSFFPTLENSITQAAIHLPVPKSFSESRLVVRYLKGKVNENEMKNEFEKIFSDLNIFFDFWFENKANNNVKLLHELIRTVGSPFLKLTDALIATSQKAQEHIELLQKMSSYNHILPKEVRQEFEKTKSVLSNFQKLDLEFVKSFLSDQSISEKLPNHFINTILAYAIGNTRINRRVQISDTGDLMHACYLPFCDIWRGDIKFCNLLVDQKVDGYQKTVNRLSLLPNVIENKLMIQKTGSI